MDRLILHVSEVDIAQETGMGRVEWYWKKAFERAGYSFLHVGPAEIGPIRHPFLFPTKAYHHYKGLHINPAAIIVHEPAAGVFVNKGTPCFVESHGVERRYWEANVKSTIPRSNPISWKTRLLFPIWRLRGCDKGLENAQKLLLINTDDSTYVRMKYKRKDEDIFIFKNGINSDALSISPAVDRAVFTVLFNGSWIARKGIDTLIKAAQILYEQQYSIQYIIAGTGLEASQVLRDWPDYLTSHLKIIKRFSASEELNLLEKCDVFVLPSFFEGQPLSLLQAMAAGRCCITTNCCGQKDIITHLGNGLLFEPGDSVELAGLIKRCYQDRNWANVLGKVARTSVEVRTWENSADEVVRFITSNLIVA